MNGETYHMSFSEDYWDVLPLANYNNIWFQYDGAPPHNTRQVLFNAKTLLKYIYAPKTSQVIN